MPARVEVKKRTGKLPWKVVTLTTGKVVASATTKKIAEDNAKARNKAAGRGGGYGKKPRQVKGVMRLTDATAAR